MPGVFFDVTTPVCDPALVVVWGASHYVNCFKDQRKDLRQQLGNYILSLCYAGMMELPVKQLSQPPRESRLLREADPTFVRNLKLKMTKDPSAPGSSSMAVLRKDIETTSDFSIKYKNVYKYEVLGGLHTLVAKTQLMSEYPNNPFFKSVMADVHIGLTDEEALRLAQCHNLNSHFIHKVTHRDLVS